MSDNEEPMEVIDDSSDTESSGNDEEEIQLKRAQEFENDLLNNKYLYDVHIQLVDIYRSLGDLKSMRAAYERFHEVFPLTPKLWLKWIRDEIKVAATPDEKKNVFSLFDKAVEDYLSVELWIEYAQYSIGASDLETTRNILERGLNAAGRHVSQGSLLWDTLRELELAHFSLAQNSDNWEEQLQSVVSVFKRQLSVPLMDMENTYHEWQEFVKKLPEGTNVDPAIVDWSYKNALKTLETFKPFEEQLLATNDDGELFQIYREYAAKISDPVTKVCLYERAATALCLSPDLWVDYCLYALQLGEPALSASKRALRNVPWSEELWMLRLRILEKQEEDPSVVMACFEEGIVSVAQPALDLWLTYLEYAIRHFDSQEKLDKLFHQANEQVGYEGDNMAKISRLHARILAKRGDLQAAKKTWTNILHRPTHKGLATTWLEYYHFERQYGQTQDSIRQLFQRAVGACKDYPHCIADEWLLYERECGTLTDVIKCIEKCRNIVRPQENIEQADPEPVQRGNKRKNQFASEKVETVRKRQRIEEENDDVIFVGEETAKERKHTNKNPTKARVVRDPKVTVFVSNLSSKVTEEMLREFFPSAENVELVMDKKGHSRCFGYVQFKMEEEALHALARDREPLHNRPVYISNCKPDKNERSSKFKYSMQAEENKLFIKGLPISYTKENLEELYKPHGAVDVRLVMHKSGQSKGLAYVEFADKAGATEALKATDQMDIDGHVITVAVSCPPPKRSKELTQPQPKEPIRHPRSKLSVAFVPRQVQKKAGAPAASGNSHNGNASSESVKDNVDSKPKSNDDFRKMLLNK